MTTTGMAAEGGPMTCRRPSGPGNSPSSRLSLNARFRRLDRSLDASGATPGSGKRFVSPPHLDGCAPEGDADHVSRGSEPPGVLIPARSRAAPEPRNSLLRPRLGRPPIRGSLTIQGPSPVGNQSPMWGQISMPGPPIGRRQISVCRRDTGLDDRGEPASGKRADRVTLRKPENRPVELAAVLVVLVVGHPVVRSGLLG